MADVAYQLSDEASDLVVRFDDDGPGLLAASAERLAPRRGWALLAETREIARAKVLADPLNLTAVALLGWVTAALAVRADLDRRPTAPVVEARPVVERWGLELRQAILDTGRSLGEAARAAGICSSDLRALIMCRQPPTGMRQEHAIAVLAVIGEFPADWLNPGCSDDPEEETSWAASG